MGTHSFEGASGVSNWSLNEGMNCRETTGAVVVGVVVVVSLVVDVVVVVVGVVVVKTRVVVIYILLTSPLSIPLVLNRLFTCH